jgi:hypothetical protein
MPLCHYRPIAVGLVCTDSGLRHQKLGACTMLKRMETHEIAVKNLQVQGMYTSITTPTSGLYPTSGRYKGFRVQGLCYEGLEFKVYAK